MILKTFRIYKSYEELPEAWDDLVGHDIFLQANYLEALENATPNNIQLFYIGVFKKDMLVGIAIIQRVQFYLKDMFRKNTMSYIKELFREIVSRVLKGNVLVIGNLMHTGQHALYYNDSQIVQADFFNTLFQGLDELIQTIKKKHDKKIRAIIAKDFFTDDIILEDKSTFRNHKLHEVIVQPNMILPLRDHWHTNKDYINTLNKKYRDRYKRAKKKFGAITSKELDIDSIHEKSKTLHELYLNVSNNAKFNTFILPENHFYSLKLKLNDNFKVFGYFLNKDLIGFYTLIINGKQLETYFLGYDEEHQYPNQLYLNMLYDMLEFGIINRFSNVVYARTAMAIKSSVGAKAKPMVLYMKHTNVLMNSILRPIFFLMNPKQDWEERHPFKT
ncbi:GNAT family N-acetyltransferase [Aestuariivivens marinum]|uniref:GNAT family N-acetyltransferase n=1 Tax=Aestuariivivens marinum TaxID=2913555 RepID=UPI001F592898|nr:GNAT family N-acetyltransferase [Aestuariivivens marinum]